MAENTKRKPGFEIHHGKGFQITLENGCTLSVMFGPYHYCANGLVNGERWQRISSEGMAATAKVWGCSDAEVAVIDPEGNLIPLKWFWPDANDVVAAQICPGDVAQLLAELRLIHIHKANGGV